MDYQEDNDNLPDEPQNVVQEQYDVTDIIASMHKEEVLYGPTILYVSCRSL